MRHGRDLTTIGNVKYLHIRPSVLNSHSFISAIKKGKLKLTRRSWLFRMRKSLFSRANDWNAISKQTSSRHFTIYTKERILKRTFFPTKRKVNNFYWTFSPSKHLKMDKKSRWLLTSRCGSGEGFNYFSIFEENTKEVQWHSRRAFGQNRLLSTRDEEIWGEGLKGKMCFETINDLMVCRYCWKILASKL